jgi:hypothetical protein
MKVLRNILAVVVGLVVGGVVNMALVTASPRVIPPPAGVDVSDLESLREAMHLFEPKHFVFPFLAHALGTLAGALVAYLVAASHRPVLAYVVGAFFLLGGIAAARMIPAPPWFVALDLRQHIPMRGPGHFSAAGSQASRSTMGGAHDRVFGSQRECRPRRARGRRGLGRGGRGVQFDRPPFPRRC